MKTVGILFLTLLTGSILVNAQNITNLKTADLNYWKNQQSDTLFIINFWATWCKPCLEELPDLEKITSVYAGKKVKVILISNDFKKQLATRVIPFIQQHHLKSEVYFMDEPNSNDWIDKVNLDWGGSIPATWIIQKSSGYEKFIEGKVSFDEFSKTINLLINK